MGEFANRFSDEFLEEYDGIEWGQLIGLRINWIEKCHSP